MVRIYKGIDFGKGTSLSFPEFKKGYAGWFVSFSDEQIKKAYKIAYIEPIKEDVSTPKKRKTTSKKQSKK